MIMGYLKCDVRCYSKLCRSVSIACLIDTYNDTFIDIHTGILAGARLLGGFQNGYRYLDC